MIRPANEREDGLQTNNLADRNSRVNNVDQVNFQAEFSLDWR